MIPISNYVEEEFEFGLLFVVIKSCFYFILGDLLKLRSKWGKIE